MFTFFISFPILLFFIEDNYSKDDAISDMKAKYPFESFNQQTSHSS